jgi:indolepyruvate ferredoxin oxidoreductase beta subunit
MKLNMLICGVGGQGNVLFEKIIGISAVREGFSIRAADTFGASQRGGSVVSHIRLGTNVYSSLVPRCECDILVGLEPVETLRTAVSFLKDNGILIFNTTSIPTSKIKSGEETYPNIDNIKKILNKLTKNLIEINASALSKKVTGSEHALNMTLVGVLLGIKALPLNSQTVKSVIYEKTGTFAKKNIRAFDLGYEVGAKKATGKNLKI